MTLKLLSHFSQNTDSEKLFFNVFHPRFFHQLLLTLQKFHASQEAVGTYHIVINNVTKMDPIALHLETLLRYHDCVIMPGIGALIASSQPARFDRESARFIAPQRTICFNAAVRNDDGLLASSYCRRLKVSYQEGRSIMLRELASLSASLEADGEVTLGMIGTLTRDAEGHIEFRPRVCPDKASAAIGLDDISIADLMPAATETSTDAAEVTANENEAPISPRRFNPDYYYIPVHKGFAKVAAAVMLFVLVAVGILLPTESTDQPVKASLLPVKEISLHPLDDKDNRAETAIPSAEADSVTATAADAYQLIVASFRNDTEARKFIAACPGHALHLEKTKSMWLVSAAESSNKESLLAKSADTSFKAVFPQSWVWKRR